MHKYLLATSLLSGCATFGTFQRADTLGEGGIQVALEPSMWGGSFEGKGGMVPQASVSMRYGVGERVDIGARVGTGGFEALGKFQLTDPEYDAVVVSLAPSGGGFGFGSTEASAAILSVQVPLLIGLRIGEDHQLVLAPKVHDWIFFAAAKEGASVAHVVSAGGSVGLAIRLGKRFTLLPEVAMLKPVWMYGANKYGDATYNPFGDDVVMSQYSVGLLVDLGRPERRRWR